jgi:NAD+ kinase
MSQKKVYLYVKHSPNAYEFASKLFQMLEKWGYQAFTDQEELRNIIPVKDKEEIKKAFICIVIGGDGTFLAGARKVAPLGIPIVGINLGRFGFLTEIETIEVNKLLPKVLKGEAPLQERLIFEVCICKEGEEEEFIDYAVNDVVVSKSALARMIDISIDTSLGHLGTISGDGIIVATPTGSTAYALASGGPIVYPTLLASIIVPICPHTLTQRPIVISDEVEVILNVKTPYSEVFLTIDGQVGRKLSINEKVIIRKAPFKLKMFLHPYRNYFDLLRIKLKWGKR